MSCIIGLKTHEGIMMYADSAHTFGNLEMTGKNPKIYVDKDIKAILGVAGKLRTTQIIIEESKEILQELNELYQELNDNLITHNNKKQQPADDPIYTWVINNYVPRIRQRLKDRGISSVSENVEEHNGIILLGIDKRLFEIAGDFSVFESIENYAAIGAGWDLAIASLRTSEVITHDLYYHALVTAMDTVSNFIQGVTGPYLMLRNFYREKAPIFVLDHKEETKMDKLEKAMNDLTNREFAQYALEYLDKSVLYDMILESLSDYIDNMDSQDRIDKYIESHVEFIESFKEE